MAETLSQSFGPGRKIAGPAEALEIEIQFHYHFLASWMMACTPRTADDLSPEPRTAAPAMTRCECAEVSFDEAARRMNAEGLTVEELTRRTGCGGNCTACIPDLRRFLAQRRS
jgi:bacterioferritin-associated ferredoxin